MTAHAQSTRFYTDCKVADHDGFLLLTGTFSVRADIVPSAEELDQIIDLADQIGQFLKRNIATTTIEHADQRAARLAQDVAPHLHKHGRRPFTMITPFGRLKPNRIRLLEKTTGKTRVPSALLWKTSQNRHIVTALAESARKTSQKISYRQSKTRLSADARVDDLLAHSTVWNLKQSEEHRLENAQRQFSERVLAEYGETLESHGFLPPLSKIDSRDEIVDETIPEEIEEEADALYEYFTTERRKIKVEIDTRDKGDDAPAKRHVPMDAILLQADEVVTKTQEPGRKANKTFTATLETGTGRCEYLATRSSETLQILVAAILVLLGILSGKKLEVISDGATWIGNWIARLSGVEVYHLLCWYHLCKRVCVGLSGMGTSKEEREKIQKEILGRLWHGDVNGAIGILKSILPRCRVRSRVEELIDYLGRKRSWIGDYAGRQESGLWIASTRVEKWNDIAVSERCKHRGMSWTESGVLAMALHAGQSKRSAAQTAQIDVENHTSL